MTNARVFQSGNHQAIRLPEEFRFNTDEVEIFRRDNEVILRERTPSAAEIFDILASFPEDFMAGGRQDEPPQNRESL